MNRLNRRQFLHVSADGLTVTIGRAARGAAPTTAAAAATASEFPGRPAEAVQPHLRALDSGE